MNDLKGRVSSPESELAKFPGGSDDKASFYNAGDLGLIPGWGRSPGEGKGLHTPVFWPGEFHGLYSMGLQRVRHD